MIAPCCSDSRGNFYSDCDLAVEVAAVVLVVGKQFAEVAETIAVAVETYFEQTYAAAVVVVVVMDDGSCDDTEMSLEDNLS